MSQGIFDTINPNTTSGTQLATILDDFKDAVVSGFSGTSRPANLQEYGYWIDTTNEGTGILVYQFYDGTNDIPVFTINTNTGSILLSGVADSFRVEKTSDDTVGSKVILEKKRETGGGQTLENDILGDVDFEGNDSSSVSYVQARIRVTSLDDVSGSEQGADIAISATPVDGASLTEVMRIKGDRTVGIGNNTPTKSLDVFANDTKAGIKTTIAEDSINPTEVILQKKRIATNGQVVSGDGVGNVVFKSVDQNGAEIEVAKIEVEATETHTDTAQGTSFKISTKKNGENTLSENISIVNGVVSIGGQELTDERSTNNLLSGTNNLFSVDGSLYGAFEAVIFFHGNNNTITRQQKVTYNGVYDFDNTTWLTSNDSDSMGGSDKVVTLSETDAETLLVDYTNQVPTFADGKIYIKITRYLR